MRRLFTIAHDLTGNLPALPDVFPDQMAPVVRMHEGEHQLEMMRWGMPGPPQFGGAPITNIRNTGWAGEPLPGARELVLRIRRHEAAEDANLVRARGQPTAIRVRRDLGAVARRSRHQGQPG